MFQLVEEMVSVTVVLLLNLTVRHPILGSFVHCLCLAILSPKVDGHFHAPIPRGC